MKSVRLCIVIAGAGGGQMYQNIPRGRVRLARPKEKPLTVFAGADDSGRLWVFKRFGSNFKKR